MEPFEEGVRAGVVILDANVVHDIATTLTGDWSPDSVADDVRRAEMIAAARVRLYADRDQYGWYLAATPGSRETAMGYSGAAWSVGFIQDVATMDGAPPLDDVIALEKIFREAGIVGASAKSLAYAVLFDRVTYVLTTTPTDLKHQREHDLPTRLAIMSPVEVVDRLQLVAGEEPMLGPPSDSELATGPHWWVTG